MCDWCGDCLFTNLYDFDTDCRRPSGSVDPFLDQESELEGCGALSCQVLETHQQLSVNNKLIYFVSLLSVLVCHTLIMSPCARSSYSTRNECE
jgi:hypothetical protein